MRSQLPAAALQRARPPPPARFAAPAPKQEAGLRLTYPGESMEEHHHPSPAPVLLPAVEPETGALPAPDPAENFANPAMMQAIISSMNPLPACGLCAVTALQQWVGRGCVCPPHRPRAIGASAEWVREWA